MELKRFVIQKVALPISKIEGAEELYVRRLGLPIVDLKKDKDGGIRLLKNCKMSFDTYFNSFSLLKWVTYTYVNNVNLSITFKGHIRITLIHMFLTANRKLHYEAIRTEEFSNPTKTTIDLDFKTDSPFGELSFKIESLSDNSYYYDACYYSNLNPEYVQPIKLGIGICTYKRENYVLDNVQSMIDLLINNNKSPLHNNLEIFISDNAGTLKNFNNKHVHIVKNKNTGGSGGFTRCMIEALKYNDNNKNKITNLIMTDDDIIFDCESIERTYTILSLLLPKYKDSFVGGAMFRFDTPYIQHASGEHWYGHHCESFIDTYNKNRDMRDIINMLENENFVDCNYQAWWYCAIPMTIIRYDNLPMPFFIKSDDIEYSARNAEHVILLNGICVWHESFESKYAAQNEYYTVRNYLISAASKEIKLSKERVIKFFTGYVKHYVCNYKYLEIDYFCQAINDFLAGVEHVKKIDLEKCHKETLKRGYKIVKANELPVAFTKNDFYRDIGYEPRWSKKHLLFAKLTLNGLFLPAKGYSVLGMWGGSVPQTYRKKFLVRYEPSTNKGFILYRNRKECIRMLKLVRKTLKNIKKNFDAAYDDFARNWKKLTEYENWKKQLNLKE